MVEFIVLQHPLFAPNACVGCGGSTGTMTDTHRELPGYGRVYLCHLCVTRAARVHGLVKGKRMNELENADALLDAAQQQLHDKHRELVETQEKLDEANRRIGVVEDDNEFLTNRVETLRSRLKAEAEASLAALGDTA